MELRARRGAGRITKKKPEVVEYFRFKGRLTTPAFIEVLNDAGIQFEPHDGQWQIIDAYEERIPASESVIQMALENGINLDFEYKYRVISAICGRRMGKSVIASVLGAQEMLVPNARVLIVSYTFSNCQVIYDNVRKIIVDLLGKDEIVADRQQAMELILKNGAELRVGSNDSIDSLLGKAVSLLIVDEAKVFKEQILVRGLLPMLLDYAPFSRTVLISSPENNWIEGWYKRGQSDEYPRYWSINLPTHANPTIPREELDQMKKDLPPEIYEQEVLGLFTSNAGLVCREFTKERNVYRPEDYPFLYEWLHSGNVIINMIDSGYSHYFASVWVMYVEELDTYFAFAEYAKNKTLTSEHARYINEFEAENDIQVDIRFAAPAASQQLADFTEYDLYFNKAAKVLRETINNLNTLFFQTSEITGKPRLLVSTECPELIRQLSSVIWKTGKDDEQTKEQSAQGTKPFTPDKEGPVGGGNKTDWDLFDAFRYGLFSFIKNNRVDATVITTETGNQRDASEDEFDEMLYSRGWFRFSDSV